MRKLILSLFVFFLGVALCSPKLWAEEDLRQADPKGVLTQSAPEVVMTQKAPDVLVQAQELMDLVQVQELSEKEGFENFTTTLLYSKYQNHELIREISERECKKSGINFIYYDFLLYFE